MPDVPSDSSRPSNDAAKSLTLADIQEKPRSYLEHGIDKVASLAISDDSTRAKVDHYAGEVLKTAALFASGRLGMSSAALLYGLDQASPDTKWSQQLADFTLGGTKGAVMKGMFNAISRDVSFAPAKGVLMGIASRDTDILFNRDTFTNPGKTWSALKAETINPQAWLLDGATFAVGEGLFRGVNNYTGGMLAKSPLLSGMAMGSSFGFVSGGTAEIMRQKNAGESINVKRIVEQGAIEAGVNALGAGLGVKASDPALHASVKSNLRLVTDKAQHLIHGGPDAPLPQVDPARHTDLEAHQLLQKQLKLLTLHAPHRGNVAPGEAAKIVESARTQGGSPAESTGGGGPEPQPKETGRLLPGFKRTWIHGLTNEATTQGEPAGKPTEVKTDAKQELHKLTFNVMGPLEIGNSREPNAQSSRGAWEEFGRQLDEAKRLGADAVSTDVWWGVVEPREGKFNWEYYDLLSKAIIDKGLKWVPILSFHQCGGNIGDTSYIPVPFWLWNNLDAKLGQTDSAKFVSEQGNKSSEYIGFHADDAALPRYRSVMESFQEHFANKAPYIAEINVSLGPAGEARYPSYNSHDQNTGYPTRGALQAYNPIAVEQFKQAAIAKYGTLEELARVWNIKTTDPIRPPDNPDFFFSHQDHMNTQYGRDLYDWYSDSLINHGRKVLGTAIDVFAAKDAKFAGIDIGAKIPGVHWRVGEWQGDHVVLGDRLAELNAGLIRTSDANDWGSDQAGHGYRKFLNLFTELQKRSPYSRIVPHFTALELTDGQDGSNAKALPYTLATWVGQEASRQGLPIKGENALNFTLTNPQAWDHMQSLLKTPTGGYYYGLTLLRVGDVVNNETARRRFQQMVDEIKKHQPAPPAEQDKSA
jgi:hypothetical protein